MVRASEFLDIYIDGLLAGDEQAIASWYRKAKPRLLRYIRSRVSKPSDAEEICNDTFLSCLESIGVFSRRSTLWSWMCSICGHEIADYYRKKYAKRVLRILPFGELVMEEGVPDMHESAAAVQSTVLSNLRFLQERIRRTLRTLSREDQELLQQKYLDGRSVKELANAQKVSFKSMESRLYRVRKAFMQAYAIEGQDE